MRPQTPASFGDARRMINEFSVTRAAGGRIRTVRLLEVSRYVRQDAWASQRMLGSKTNVRQIVSAALISLKMPGRGFCNDFRTMSAPTPSDCGGANQPRYLTTFCSGAFGCKMDVHTQDDGT